MSERTKWTPGPWRHVSMPGGWDGVSDELGAGICLLRLNNPANADLIAAAPELYKAVLALLPEGWGDDDTMDHMPGVKRARAALAKARGE
jgi:hypothetical protein